MNRLVFEELYRAYYGYHQQAPYDYYAADYVISPRDTKNHDYYFQKVRTCAEDLCHIHLMRFIREGITDSDYKNVKWIVEKIIHAQDMVELVWYSIQLQSVVRRELLTMQQKVL